MVNETRPMNGILFGCYRYLLVLFAVLAVFGCEMEALDNTDFDMWCGDQLCAWDLNAGTIQKVPMNL